MKNSLMAGTCTNCMSCVMMSLVYISFIDIA